jgi:hypothetical protein
MRPTVHRPLALAISVVVLAGASTATVRDAYALPTSAQEGAREAFANGERLFSRGAYGEAREAFEKAFRLVSHDAVRFNIAVCLERLQRYRDALTQYRAAMESTMLDASERTRAADAAARVTRELGTLVVSGSGGAPVSVDGEVRCSVPCRVLLDPRTYLVAVGAGARTARASPSRSVVIERGADVTVDASAFQPADAPQVPEAAAPSAPTSKRGVSWVTWAGGGLGLLGVGGVVGFGLHTESLRSSYVDDPNESTRDQGLFSRTMTNVSLGIAVVGLALVVVDLLVLAPRPRVERR